MIGGHLLHGGDYNPEQWIEYPEILEEDLKLMNKAKCKLCERSECFLGRS